VSILPGPPSYKMGLSDQMHRKLEIYISLVMLFLVYVASFTLMFVLPEGLTEAFETETDTGRDDLEIGTKNTL
jgi:hypothetical protein